MEKIDELKTQPIIGEYYLVPCIIKDIEIKKEEKETEDYENWEIINGQLDKRKSLIKTVKKKEIYPIINHLHSDKENGQEYKHYHIDYRFVEVDENSIPKKLHSKHIFGASNRYNVLAENKTYKIEYHKLKCVRNNNLHITSVLAIKKSKLKHNCIYKGKCPHRGYDLSQEPIINGIITCPLHGLKFDAVTKEIIK